MNRHLTIEDYEKYIEDNITEEYLLWMETIQEHILECAYCQERLEKFLLADALSENFNARAFVGMEGYLQKKEETELRENFVERIKQALQQIAKIELWESVKKSIENGLTNTVSFSRNNYPGMLYAVRGENMEQDILQQGAVHRVEWIDGQIRIYVKAQKEKVRYLVELKLVTSEECDVQTKIALTEKTMDERELVATFTCDSQAVKYEVTLIPIINETM